MEDKGGDKMKIKMILGIFFVLIILAACPSISTNRYMIRLHIEGTITYSDTGEPVAHCRIELWRVGGALFDTYHLETTSSDGNGWYCIKKRITNLGCFGGWLVLRVYIEEQRRWSNEEQSSPLIDCMAEGLQIINIEVDPL
jgi:hypothetical protein